MPHNCLGSPSTSIVCFSNVNQSKFLQFRSVLQYHIQLLWYLHYMIFFLGLFRVALKRSNLILFERRLLIEISSGSSQALGLLTRMYCRRHDQLLPYEFFNFTYLIFLKVSFQTMEVLAIFDII